MGEFLALEARQDFVVADGAGAGLDHRLARRHQAAIHHRVAEAFGENIFRPVAAQARRSRYARDHETECVRARR